MFEPTIDDYYPAFSIQNVILNKVNGAALNAGGMYCYRDSQRITPKSMYQMTGTYPNYEFVQLPNPVPISQSGQFVDIDGNPVMPFFLPFDADGNPDYYYVKVVTSFGNPSSLLQFDRQRLPFVKLGGTPPDALANSDNEITNPQFVQTFLSNSGNTVLTFSGAINEVASIAPGWDLVVSGTGTVTLTQHAPSDTSIPTQPPYLLDINSAGLSVVTLRQRLSHSPRFAAGNYVNGYFIAKSLDGDSNELTLRYAPSAGSISPTNIIAQGIAPSSGVFVEIFGSLEIVGTLNDNPATIGYVDINLDLPATGNVRVSSFQLVGTSENVITPFAQQTTNRQIDHLFNVFQSSIQTQSKTSITPWWFFRANPKQFGGTDASVTSQCSYIFDQTILYQPAANQVGISLDTQGLKVVAVAGATDARFAIMTYIAPQSARSVWGYFISSFVRAALSTTHSSQITIKMRALYRTTLPPSISSTEPISSWTLGQDPNFAAGWTAIAPLNDPAYTLTNGVNDEQAGDDAFPGWSFNQFQLPTLIGTQDVLAMVFYIMEPLDSTPAAEDFVSLVAISTVKNQFAIDWTPTSYAEVLHACQFYYETSYVVGVPVGTITDDNVEIVWVDSVSGISEVTAKAEAFNVKYQDKTNVPTFNFYSPLNGASGHVAVTAYAAFGGTYSSNSVTEPVATYWHGPNVSTKIARLDAEPFNGNIVVPLLGASAPDPTRAHVYFHWEADSTLGR